MNKYSAFQTICPSVPVRCAPVVSPVDKFDEIASPVTNYASSANKWIKFSTPIIDLEKLIAPTEIECF